MSPANRAPIEAALGRDFGDVRIHTGRAAADSADLLGARAYTLGSEIVFGNGQYAPHTPSGRQLLAHELAHVAQQRPTSRAPRAIDPSPTGEAEAQSVAVRVGGGASIAAPAPTVALTTVPSSIQRQSMAAQSGRDVRSLSDDQLQSELTRTVEWVDTHDVTDAQHQQMETYATQLTAERDRRATSVPAATGPGEPLATQGRPRVQVVESQGVPLLVRVPVGAGLASGQIDEDRAMAALHRNGVGVVGADQVQALAEFMGSQPADPPTPTGAAALPTGSTIQWLLGRFYPFGRPLTTAELAAVRANRIVHLTSPAAIEGSTGVRAVGLNPSRNLFLNMTDPRVRNNVWAFIGEPTTNQVGINLAGRGGRAAMAAVVLEGSNLPDGTLFRPLDRALMIPGQYTGDRVYFGAGQPVPAPPARAVGPVTPQVAAPPTLASELERAGAFSGHPAAAGGSSAAIAIVIDTGVYIVTRGELPPPERVASTGLSAGAGGLAGAITEQAAARALAAAFAQAGGKLIILGRGAAGGAGGAVAGPIVETLQLALDTRAHSGGEYASAAGRGFIAGAAGGFLGAAVTGALAGSVAPGVGTAIGFVAGAVTYAVINWLLK